MCRPCSRSHLCLHGRLLPVFPESWIACVAESAPLLMFSLGLFSWPAIGYPSGNCFVFVFWLSLLSCVNNKLPYLPVSWPATSSPCFLPSARGFYFHCYRPTRLDVSGNLTIWQKMQIHVTFWRIALTCSTAKMLRQRFFAWTLEESQTCNTLGPNVESPGRLGWLQLFLYLHPQLSMYPYTCIGLVNVSVKVKQKFSEKNSSDVPPHFYLC